ncbi:MAG: amidohydrolase [Burkholderiaceae bacterium]
MIEALTVYTARRIHTMDAGRPLATAIAVAGERIVSVGSLQTLAPWLERIPHRIDRRFENDILMPGFIDPHTHLRMSGVFQCLHYVGPIESHGPTGPQPPCASRDQVLARIRALVGALDDPSEPVICWGFDPGMQGGHLDRDMLDAISTVTPIWVSCYAPHIVYTNTPMIALTDVTEDSHDHGIGRFADGRLNGWFVETEAYARAMRPLVRRIYQPGFGERALRVHAASTVRAGITCVADMGWGLTRFEDEWRDHAALAADTSFPLRMVLVPFEPALRRRYGADRFDFLDEYRARSSTRLSTHGVKWINDGSYPAMTLQLNFPGYLDRDDGRTGEVPWQEMLEVMAPYWERGDQIHSHANGDATVDMTLDTLAALQLRKPRFDHRFTIEHYCISTPAQARRLAALGGAASVNPYFVNLRAQIHADMGFGPDRAEATARLGSLARAGAAFCLHSDYNLVVAPMAPLTAAWNAVNRLAADGHTVVAPGERISVDRALRAITIDAAFVLRRDHELGSLEAGKLADFAVLAQDPFEVDPTELKDIAVRGVVTGGVVHMADG